MRYFGDKLNEISFPIGGIGTGCIGLGGDGRLIDWEIFNRPSKGSINEYSHFAIRALQGDKITAAVLNGDIRKNHMGRFTNGNYIGYGFGPNRRLMGGYPHFGDVVFDGEFPIASLRFKDDKFPADINMIAFNPFIPLDSFNSGIPGAFFEFEIHNTTNENVRYQLAFSVANPYEGSVNHTECTSDFKLMKFECDGVEKNDITYGDLTVATDGDKVYSQSYWYRGTWNDSISTFWDEFATEKDIHERSYDTPGKYDTGTLINEVVIAAGEKKRVRFVLTWNVPNNYNYWDECKNEDGSHKIWKNYYATVFKDSAHTAVYCLNNWDELYTRTLKFKDALYGSTLPGEVIDAASACLSVLKSPTVLRLEDGSFYGWEGVQESAGSCEGTCQHVWNYAYAMCFLFPDLERSIRDMEFKYSTDVDGRMGFRIRLPLGREMTDFRACVDGQMGAVIKCYREWKISGDNEWLRYHWENIKKVLEYAWSEDNKDCWDLNKDGVLEGRQHHTLDTELFGPSSWLQGMYLLALKAASEMAEFLGDCDKKQEYEDIYNNGREWTKNNLFNGKYFIQDVDLTDKSLLERFDAVSEYWNFEKNEIKYQIGEGSAIDQILGQWHADLLGLGDIFDPDQISTALGSMLTNNYKSSMRYFYNSWRVFALNDESGTIICDYPDNVRKPKIPIPYCDETMTGFEYSFAGLLCSRGKTDDGLKVVRSVRDRFDGKKRNPWNEFECGSNYARSMASYALIPIMSGFEFDMPRGHIGFAPCDISDFSCIWSLADAWGNFEVGHGVIRLNIFEGSLSLKSFGAKFCGEVSSVSVDGKPVDFGFENGKIHFNESMVSDCIEIKFS